MHILRGALNKINTVFGSDTHSDCILSNLRLKKFPIVANLK